MIGYLQRVVRQAYFKKLDEVWFEFHVMYGLRLANTEKKLNYLDRF
jgi:hypothetical protein